MLETPKAQSTLKLGNNDVRCYNGQLAGNQIVYPVQEQVPQRLHECDFYCWSLAKLATTTKN